MKFKIKIETGARKDIQEAINWYNAKQKGLGKVFHLELINHISILEMSPYFSKRYDNVHCLPMKKFPFMIHFTIDDCSKVVIIRAVLHTAISPQQWKRYNL